MRSVSVPLLSEKTFVGGRCPSSWSFVGAADGPVIPLLSLHTFPANVLLVRGRFLVLSGRSLAVESHLQVPRGNRDRGSDLVRDLRSPPSDDNLPPRVPHAAPPRPSARDVLQRLPDLHEVDVHRHGVPPPLLLKVHREVSASRHKGVPDLPYAHTEPQEPEGGRQLRQPHQDIVRGHC